MEEIPTGGLPATSLAAPSAPTGSGATATTSPPIDPGGPTTATTAPGGPATAPPTVPCGGAALGSGQPQEHQQHQQPQPAGGSCAPPAPGNAQSGPHN